MLIGYGLVIDMSLANEHSLNNTTFFTLVLIVFYKLEQFPWNEFSFIHNNIYHNGNSYFKGNTLQSYLSEKLNDETIMCFSLCLH